MNKRVIILISFLITLILLLSFLFFPSSSAQDIVAEVSFTGTYKIPGTTEVKSGTTSSAILAHYSADASDVFDIPHPPIPPADIYLETPLIIGTERLLRDARPPKAENIFTLRVRLIGDPLEITLTWNLARLLATYSAQLTDTQTKQVINLRNQPSYTFSSPADSSRIFTLVLSTTAPIPTPAPTPVPSPTPIITPTPAPVTVTTPLAAPTPAPATAPPAPTPPAQPTPVTKPALTPAQQPTPAAATPQPASPSPSPPSPEPGPFIPPGTSPVPSPLVLGPKAPISTPPPLPGQRPEEAESPISSLIVIFIIILAVVIAASYLLFRLLRKGARI